MLQEVHSALPLATLAQRMERWLDNDTDPPGGAIEDWLLGHALPAVGHVDEPYQWIVRGLPLASGRYHAEERLARRLARFLRRAPDLESVGPLPEKLLWNALSLAAELACAEQLGSPLYEMFERQALKGSWRSLALSVALRDALIANQLDARMEQVWMALAAGQVHPFLGGRPEDGIDGIRLMPPSRGAGGQPALSAIGLGLKHIAIHYADDHDRRFRFRECLAKIVNTYPGRPKWNQDLIEQADRASWPRWSVESLDSLVETIDRTEQEVHVLAWHFVAECIPDELAHRVSEHLCDGIVYKLTLGADALSTFQLVAPLLERARKQNSLSSDRSMDAAANHGMNAIELVCADSNERLRQYCMESRRKLLSSTLRVAA